MSSAQPLVDNGATAMEIKTRPAPRDRPASVIHFPDGLAGSSSCMSSSCFTRKANRPCSTCSRFRDPEVQFPVVNPGQLSGELRMCAQ